VLGALFLCTNLRVRDARRCRRVFKSLHQVESCKGAVHRKLQDVIKALRYDWETLKAMSTVVTKGGRDSKYQLQGRYRGRCECSAHSVPHGCVGVSLECAAHDIEPSLSLDGISQMKAQAQMDRQLLHQRSQLRDREAMPEVSLCDRVEGH
jgi:hypothetical protein